MEGAVPAPAGAPSARAARRPRSYEAGIIALLVVATLIAAPFIDHSYRFLSIAISTGISAITLYGLGILFGQAGMLSIAHAALMGVGAYTAAILAGSFGLGFWSSIPFAMVTTALVAGILGLPSLRVAGHHFIIITFAFGALFSIAMTNGGSFTGAAAGLDVGPVGYLLGINLDKISQFLLLDGFLGCSVHSRHLARQRLALRPNAASTARERGAGALDRHPHGLPQSGGLHAERPLRRPRGRAPGLFPPAHLAHALRHLPQRLLGPHGDAGRPAHALRAPRRSHHRELPARGHAPRPGRLAHRLRRGARGRHHAAARAASSPASSTPIAGSSRVEAGGREGHPDGARDPRPRKKVRRRRGAGRRRCRRPAR